VSEDAPEFAEGGILPPLEEGDVVRLVSGCEYRPQTTLTGTELVKTDPEPDTVEPAGEVLVCPVCGLADCFHPLTRVPRSSLK
jgi:hypothetical protein